MQGAGGFAGHAEDRLTVLHCQQMYIDGFGVNVNLFDGPNDDDIDYIDKRGALNTPQQLPLLGIGYCCCLGYQNKYRAADPRSDTEHGFERL